MTTSLLLAEAILLRRHGRVNRLRRVSDVFDRLAESQLGEVGVSEGKMFGMRVLKIGTKVFAGEWENGLTFKLPRGRVEELKADGTGEPFEPMAGRAMKEWILVKDSKEDAKGLADEARRFVGS
jgi:hypothetical protein